VTPTLFAIALLGLTFSGTLAFEGVAVVIVVGPV